MKKLTEKDYLNNIENLEKEIDKIFDELIVNKNTTGFQNQEYIYKLEILSDEIAKNIDLIYDEYNIDFDILKTKANILKISALLNIILLFINVPTALIINIFLAYLSYKNNNKLKYNNNKMTILNNKLFPKLKKIDTEIENCYGFIHYNQTQTNNRANDKSKNIAERKFDIANEIIYLYIENDITYWEEIPESIKTTIIDILQDELKTNENNITNLIAIAKKKVEYEDLENEITEEDILKLIK